MTDTRRTYAVLALLVAGAVLSVLLLLEHRGQAVSALAQLCGEGAQSGCETVARSRWAEVGGVPLAAIGIFFYASLCAWLLLSRLAQAELHAGAAKLAFLALAAALAIDVVLLGLQAFSIGAYCRLCLASYAVNLAALALLWPARRSPVPGLGAGEGRLVVAGWLLASTGASGAALAYDAALQARENAAGASLFTPSGGDALRQSQERARTLQETLDDPAKLESYLQEKALRDYESAPARQVSFDGAPFQGPAGAPILVVTYSDFLCPFCRTLAQGLNNFVPQAGGRVAVYFKHYPLDQACNPHLSRTVHPGACRLALGGMCANEQGRFWPFHDKVFSSRLENPGDADVKRLAAEAGLDVARFGACLASPGAGQRLAADIEEARRNAVEATPTVLVNGKKLPSINNFLQVLEKESARLGLPPLAPPQPARPGSSDGNK